MKLFAKSINLTYEQEADCCSPTDLPNLLEIKIQNGGAGVEDNFVVIETERWAIDSGDELRKIADEVDRMLKESQNP